MSFLTKKTYKMDLSFFHPKQETVALLVVDCLCPIWREQGRATGANLAQQMDWELSGELSPDYLL